ncbi:MAG: glycerol dehydrogenase [Woeseiaceae bacterium]
MADNRFDPKTVFAQEGVTPPRVFTAPQRYIQGAGVLDHTGHYVNSLMKVQRAAILASKRGLGAQGAQVAASLQAESIESVNTQFNGECSMPEIEAHVAALRDQKVDCLIAVGGGKVADAGKCIAHRLDIPVVVVPTLATTDAPCSALSLVYTPEGTTDHVEFFPQNPEMIVVDTDVVANASERYLVAGMGDAMATWYEARVCLNNPAARNMHGAQPTLASCAIGEICAHTLFEHGEAAAESVLANKNNDAVDKVVEANTLLSGLGFESGGLALAHAIAVAYPEIDVVHDNYLHGEMVAMGTMAQLAMEKSDDAERVARFFARIGLPIHFGQISLSPQSKSDLDSLIEAALARPIAHHMPMPVTHETLQQAIQTAHEFGLAIAKDVGDDAYKRLQA